MKKEMIIDLIAILDRSGSMRGKETDVIGGFNKFIDDQRKIPGDAYVTLVLFDDQYEVVYNRVAIKSIPELTKKLYYTRGNTALLDAVGKTISGAAAAEKAIVFIFTDGMENASKEYKRHQVKELVEAREKAGWEVHFIGANIDAFAEGASIGTRSCNTVQTQSNSAGIAASAHYMSLNSARYRSANQPIPGWDEEKFKSVMTDKTS